MKQVTDADVLWLSGDLEYTELINSNFLRLLDEEMKFVPIEALAPGGEVYVGPLIHILAAQFKKRESRPLVVVVSRDLKMEGIESLFGYADRERGICVVSTSRISNDMATLSSRLENLIRHELGHLRGLTHCTRKECLMCPVSSPAELDSRDYRLCSSCCRRRHSNYEGGMVHWIAAAAFLILLFLGLNVAAEVLHPCGKTPFSIREEHDESPSEATIEFQNEGIWTINPSHLASDLEQRLNALFSEIDPTRIEVASSSPQQAVLTLNEEELIFIHSENAAGEASRLASKLNRLLHAKGSDSSSCAACHLDRKPEVLQAAYGRKWFLDHLLEVRK